MYSRSLHKKSRNGCGRCKKRRVKCDFRAPICSNCERREETCSYEAIYNNDPNSRTELAPPAASNVAPVQNYEAIYQSDLECGTDSSPSTASTFSLCPAQSYEATYHSDLDFRRDSSVSTESTISLVQYTRIPKPFIVSIFSQTQPGDLLSLVKGIGDHQRWDPLIVQEIGKHEFLQHAFFALSTLYEKQSMSFITKTDLATACEHHIEASSIFRQSAPALKESQWLAGLAFAMTVVIFQLRITTIQANNDCMAETLLVLRSGANFAKSVAPHFMAERLLRNRDLQTIAEPLDPQILHAIGNLEKFVSGYNWADNFEAVYEHPVQALKQWLGMTRGQPRTWLHFLWWPSSVDPKYIYLLAQRDPVAVIIFLHWCAVMVNAPERWFLDGWASTMAMKAFDSLDVEWMPSVSWPNLVFAGGNDLVLAQVFEKESQ